jgi:hypothetical protein
MSESGLKHYDVSKYLDLTLNKAEIASAETNYDVNPGLIFHITMSNNSEYTVEFDRIQYEIRFMLPLKGNKGEGFVLIGKGYALIREVLSPREKRDSKLLFEIPHLKLIAINKTLGIAKTIEAKLFIAAYFMRWPSTFLTLPLLPPGTVMAWSEVPDFPPIGCVAKDFDFKIAVDEWEQWIERIKKAIG